MSLSRIVDKDDYNLCDPLGAPPAYPQGGLYTIIADYDKGTAKGQGLFTSDEVSYIMKICPSNNECHQITTKDHIFDLTNSPPRTKKDVPEKFYFEQVQMIGHRLGFTAYLKERTHNLYVSPITSLLYIDKPLPGLGVLTYSDQPQRFQFLFNETHSNFLISCVIGDQEYDIRYFINPKYNFIPNLLLCRVDLTTAADLQYTRDFLYFVGSNATDWIGSFMISGYPIVYGDIVPTENINFCRGDCVSSLKPTDNGQWKCTYDIDRISSEFLQQWTKGGWKLPPWDKDQKEFICSKINPFTAPLELCDGQTNSKDQYCTRDLTNFFSNNCLEYMKDTLTSTKELRPDFIDFLDKKCPNIKRGITPPVKVSDEVWKRARETCNCVLSDKEKKETIETLEKNYNIDKNYLKILVSKPTNCWLDVCQDQNIPLLKDYNGCGDLTICIENVEIDSTGNIDNVDIKQSEACKDVISKKSGGGGGGGSDSGKSSNHLILWVGIGVAVFILFLFIIIKLVRTRKYKF